MLYLLQTARLGISQESYLKIILPIRKGLSLKSIYKEKKNPDLIVLMVISVYVCFLAKSSPLCLNIFYFSMNSLRDRIEQGPFCFPVPDQEHTGLNSSCISKHSYSEYPEGI